MCIISFVSSWGTTIGLSLDIVGVILVSIEIFKPFKGKRNDTDDLRIASIMGVLGLAEITDSVEYTVWERMKRKCGLWGLGFILVGFIIQLIASLPLFG